MLRAARRALSRFLFRNPSCLFTMQRSALRAIDYFDVLTAFKLLKRPEWILVPWKPDRAKLEFTASLPPSASDLLLAERIISSYTAALNAAPNKNQGEEIARNTIWDVITQTHYARMHDFIRSGDRNALAGFLSRLFQTETVNGYSMGNTFDTGPHRWWLWARGIETSLVCLAEAVGIARAECPEQGEIGYELREGPSHLINRLEQYFGFRIEVPRIGAARGIMIGERFITRETCSQIYTAHRIREAVGLYLGSNLPLRIIEVGAGYGGLCYWMHRMFGDRITNYIIIDLPVSNAVQAYFLGKTLPSSTFLYHEPCVSDGNKSTINIVPHFALDEIKSGSNLLINQDSMPEMPLTEVRRYLNWGNQNVNGLFLSFNQEAYSPVNGVPQVLVPDIVANFSNYRRLSRHTSWDRRGYVEEIYRVTPCSQC